MAADHLPDFCVVFMSARNLHRMFVSTHILVLYRYSTVQDLIQGTHTIRAKWDFLTQFLNLKTKRFL